MTPEDKLREAAAGATPGKWYRQSGFVPYVVCAGGQQVARCYKNDNSTRMDREANAAFIALANPQAVTELLDRIDELEGEKVELAEGFSKLQQEAVEALHQVERLKGESDDLTQDVEAYHSDTLMLMSERDALRARVSDRDDAFKHGYLIAVANLMNMHGSDVEAEDVLQELGETEGVIKRLDLTDYDAKPLRRLFRQISRREKRSLRRARDTMEAGDG